MLKAAFLAVLLLALSSCIDGVPLELTDENFPARIKEQKFVVVMFYAPWCGHCKKLKPEFDKAASLLAENDPPVALAKVDCTESGKATCSSYRVTGYPSLKMFRNGEFSKDYNGPREASGIVNYIKNQVGPSAVALLTGDSVENFLNEPSFGVIGFFLSDSALKKAYMQASDDLRDKYRFGLSENVDVSTKYQVNDAVVLYRPKYLCNVFEECSLKYEGGDTKEEIEYWLTKNHHGIVGHRHKGNVDEFTAPLVVAYFNVDYTKNPKGTNYWRNRILKVASKFADDFNFAISSKDDLHDELDDFYEYSSPDKPVVLAKSADNKKYRMSEVFTVENFQAFLTKLKAGVLESYIKSEPIPESNDGPVKIAVAKNFEDVVNENGKDTFIEFYAPWCGHCKSLAPIWNELGERMAPEDVEIVKMDATSNDIPPVYSVQGFPTLYWVPKDSKHKPVAYDGERDLDELIKYVAKYATSELKRFDRNGNPKEKNEL